MPDINPAPEDEEVINPNEAEEEEIDTGDNPVEDEHVEEEPEEVEEPEAPVKEEPAQPSHRESLRIQKLISKLREQGQAPDEEPPKPKGGLDYRTALDADDEIISQLETDRDAHGKAQYNEGMKQAQSIQFHTRLEIDAPRVDAKFPQLNKESPKFQPEVADAVNQWYLATAGYNAKTNTVQNADVRYADFVDGIFQLAERIAGDKVAQTRKTITRQAASTGLRPDGSSPKMNLNKDPGQMTDAELDARIAQAVPPRTR